MGFTPGKDVRLFVDTSAGGSGTFKAIHHETTVGMSLGSETVDITTKDTAAFQSAIKTGTNLTLNCTAKVADDGDANVLTYEEIFVLGLETNSDSGKGIRKFKMQGSDFSVTFDGFIESVDSDFDAEDVGEYSFSIKVVTKPVLVGPS